MFERSDDREVGVVEFGVFTDEDDVDGIEVTFEADGELLPALPGLLTALVERGGYGGEGGGSQWW